MNRNLQWALATAGLWGFLEVALTYVTGTAPGSEVFEILASPLCVAAAFYVVAIALNWKSPRPAFDSLVSAGALLPLLIFILRGRVTLTATSLVVAGLPIALVLLRLWWELKNARDTQSVSLASALRLGSLYLWAGVAYTYRNDLARALTTTTLLSAAAVYFGGVLVAGLVARRMRTRAGLGVFATTIVASMAVAYGEGSGPPRFQLDLIGRTSRPAPKAGAPNVLLVVLDTVRADHLDLYGYARPTFASSGRYLSEGLIFDRATAAGSFSLSSHASLFTGLLPTAHGAQPILGPRTTYGRLWPDVKTLAEKLRDRGYSTFGVSANDVFLAEWTGLQRGFDDFAATGRRELRFNPLSMVVRTELLRRRRLSFQWASPTWSASEVTDAAIERVNAAPRPWFLFLNYFDAHSPHAMMPGAPWAPSSKSMVDAYDSEIAYVDRQLARLFDFLKSRGELDRTLVIVTADHGEYFRERRLRGHPGAVYEPGIHVPLAVRFPSSIPQGRSLRRTGLIEVNQLVTDVLDAAPLDWLTQPDLTPRILSEAWTLKDAGSTPSPDTRPTTTAVFAGDLKLIHRISGRSELFDLSADPREEHDLFGSTDPLLVVAREKLLREVMLRQTRGPAPAPALSDDAKERLRALGYVR
ncbi:MAG: sulfatase [Vicinamibacteria bacterium]